MPSNGTPIMSIRAPPAVFSAVAGFPIACSQPSPADSNWQADRGLDRSGPPGWPSRENPIYRHLRTYVTELALAAEPSRLPRWPVNFLRSSTSRERLVNKPVSVPEQLDAVVVGAG